MIIVIFLLDTELPPPKGPLIIISEFQNCELKWNRPDVNEKQKLHYKVYQKRVDMENEWSLAADYVLDTSCVVDKLQPNTWYIMKVVAVYSKGESEPLVSEAFLTKSNILLLFLLLLYLLLLCLLLLLLYLVLL